MRWKSVVLFLVILAGMATCLQAESPAVFTIDNGFLFGYNLGADNIGVANTVGFTFGISESLSAGVLYQSGDGTVILDGVFFVVDYEVLDRVRVSIQPGRYNANPAVKVGMSYDAFARSFQQLVTRLALHLDYLTDTTLGIENGIVSASLSVSFGL